jgi:hypothetical protein
MNTEFIIADTSVRYMNAANVLQEFLFYCKDNNWSRNIDNTVKYSDSNAAIDSAKKLKAEDGLDKKVFLFQKNGNVINIGEVKVPI